MLDQQKYVMVLPSWDHNYRVLPSQAQYATCKVWSCSKPYFWLHRKRISISEKYDIVPYLLINTLLHNFEEANNIIAWKQNSFCLPFFRCHIRYQWLARYTDFRLVDLLIRCKLMHDVMVEKWATSNRILLSSNDSKTFLSNPFVKRIFEVLHEEMVLHH